MGGKGWIRNRVYSKGTRCKLFMILGERRSRRCDERGCKKQWVYGKGWAKNNKLLIYANTNSSATLQSLSTCRSPECGRVGAGKSIELRELGPGWERAERRGMEGQEAVTTWG